MTHSSNISKSIVGFINAQSAVTSAVKSMVVMKEEPARAVWMLSTSVAMGLVEWS